MHIAQLKTINRVVCVCVCVCVCIVRSRSMSWNFFSISDNNNTVSFLSQLCYKLACFKHVCSSDNILNVRIFLALKNYCKSMLSCFSYIVHQFYEYALFSTDASETMVFLKEQPFLA